MKEPFFGDHHPDDATLVMLTLAGDQAAYEVLVRRHERAVRAAAYSVTHREYLAEDAAQDAFITAWIKLSALQEPSKFGAWVCRIAKNCAKNTVMRMRPYMSLDDPDFPEIADDKNLNPAELHAREDDTRELTSSIDRLPARVRQIIRLHYFEGLSVVEIAEQLQLSQGTVKWQLHDGRKRIRKELCAMNEAWNDTLIQKVMKKVEEIKAWDTKNDKRGFEGVYRELLTEIDELPECQKKQHARADVLLRGWWWVPGEQNDALLAQIKQAAGEGCNDEVMRFLARQENQKLWGDARLTYIRDKQIPTYKDSCFVGTLAEQYYYLGLAYMDRGNEGDAALAKECYEAAARTVPPSDVYHALAKLQAEIEDLAASEQYAAVPYANRNIESYVVRLARGDDGQPPLCQSIDRNSIGGLESLSFLHGNLFRGASQLDGQFAIANAPVGKKYFASDHVTTLELLSVNEVVKTPAGTFEDCTVWQSDDRGVLFTTYYKDGIGIVKQTTQDMEVVDSFVLCEYEVRGSGLLPLCEGNRWLYRAEGDASVLDSKVRYECSYADGVQAIISGVLCTVRHGYDENCWADMVQRISNEYYQQIDGHYRVCDVSHPIERAEALAVTPLQKAYTKAAGAVARRIMACDPDFHPAHTATGHWNFFACQAIRQKDGKPTMGGYRSRWGFELKNTAFANDALDPILFNDVYGILHDACDNSLGIDQWALEGSYTLNFIYWDCKIRTDIQTVRECAPVTTAAGTFEDCITLKLQIRGMGKGVEYRGGNKEYTFARGVGIVRAVHGYAQETKKALYELVSYRGTGEGYLPMCCGMQRRFEAIGLTDGFVAYADYELQASTDGRLYMFGDRCGIRNLPPPITSYDALLSEQAEEQLWEEGKHAESRLQNDVNNFNLLLHYLYGNHRGLGEPHRTSAWHKHRIRMLHALTEDGSVPPALQGSYAHFHFAAACATFGCGEEYFDEGYALLERAFELFEKWVTIPDGEALSIGDGSFSADIKLIKGKNLLILPDGRRVTCEDVFYSAWNDGSVMYRGMTASRGWEWFNGVREQERFQAYVKRALAFVEKK